MCFETEKYDKIRGTIEFQKRILKYASEMGVDAQLYYWDIVRSNIIDILERNHTDTIIADIKSLLNISDIYLNSLYSSIKKSYIETAEDDTTINIINGISDIDMGEIKSGKRYVLKIVGNDTDIIYSAIFIRKNDGIPYINALNAEIDAMFVRQQLNDDTLHPIICVILYKHSDTKSANLLQRNNYKTDELNLGAIINLDCVCLTVTNPLWMNYEFPINYSIEIDALTESNIFSDDSVISENYGIINFYPDVCMRTPYVSFEIISNRIRDICYNSTTNIILCTLYRIESESDIIKSLVHAATMGKTVIVFLELRASGSEYLNSTSIYNTLSKGGVKIYTNNRSNFKIHAKVFLSIGHDYDNTPSYQSIIGSGNFNSESAKTYADTFYLTKSVVVAADILSEFRKIIHFPIPFDVFPVSQGRFVRPTVEWMYSKMMNLITSTRKGKPRLWIKCNHITSAPLIDVIAALSDRCDVRIIVRTSCSPILINNPNIQIVSRIGEFLEHDRIYIFEESVYIGSADLISHNLNKRFEGLVKVDPRFNEILYREFESLFENVYDDQIRYINFEKDNL